MPTSFKDFLLETRDVKRSKKLVDYLTKRHGIETGQGTKIKTPNRGDVKKRDEMNHELYSLNFHDKPSGKKKIPLHKIESSQGGLFPDKVKEKLDGKDKSSIAVNQYKGKYYVRDGHHRLMRAKLLKHSHIEADVYQHKETP